MPLLRKRSKYENELIEAKKAIESDDLPHSIEVKEPGKFIQMLRYFLRDRNMSDSITTSNDPDSNRTWINRRRK